MVVAVVLAEVDFIGNDARLVQKAVQLAKFAKYELFDFGTLGQTHPLMAIH
jgi:hypothetical protein